MRSKQSFSRQERIAHAFAVADRVSLALASSLKDVGGFVPFTAAQLPAADAAAALTVDAFLKRFENAVEAGKRLFRVAVALGGEDPRDLSNTEVIDLLGRWGMIDAPEQWVEIVGARNTAIHEYAMDAEVQAEALNETYEAATRAYAVLLTVLADLRARFPNDAPPEGPTP